MTLAHEGIEKSIDVIGTREQNLMDVSVSILKDSIVVFTGISGSGKSSLVFDTRAQR
jgi:excinuclease UvrABC ATPase subunit